MSNYTVSYDSNDEEGKGMIVKFTGLFIGLQIGRFMEYIGRRYKDLIFYIEAVNFDGLHIKYYNSLNVEVIDMFSQYSHFYVMIYGDRNYLKCVYVINAFKSEISNGENPKFVTPKDGEKEFLCKHLNPKSFLCEFKCAWSNDNTVYHFIVTKLPDSFLIKREDGAIIPQNVYQDILIKYKNNLVEFNELDTFKLEGLMTFGFGGTQITALMLYCYSTYIGFPDRLPALFDKVVCSLDEE